MGIFNIFTVIPQITAATILGYFAKYILDGEAIYALLLGGVSLVIASLLMFRVKEE